MTIREKIVIKAVLVLGFALVFSVAEGAGRDYHRHFGGCRGLVDNGPKLLTHNIWCENNFAANSLNITAPPNNPNADGIQISSFNLVSIPTSNIGTGDDRVSIGQGSTNFSISKIICGLGLGISIGSLGKSEEEKDVSGITVTNCTISKTSTIKTCPASPTNIFFEDIIMDKVGNPIIIGQKYGSSKPEPNILQPSHVKINNVHFKNIRGTSTQMKLLL